MNIMELSSAEKRGRDETIRKNREFQINFLLPKSRFYRTVFSPPMCSSLGQRSLHNYMRMSGVFACWGTGPESPIYKARKLLKEVKGRRAEEPLEGEQEESNGNMPIMRRVNLG